MVNAPVSHRTRIKFCGLVREEDIRIAVTLGIDAIGFVFYEKSPRFLRMDEAIHLRRAIPSYVACVGLFVNEQPSLVLEHQRRLGLDVLQFHGDEERAQLRQLDEAYQNAQSRADAYENQLDHARPPAYPIPYWKAIRVRADTDLIECNEAFADAEALLLDSFSQAYGGTGKRFDWSQARALPRERMILSGGLDAQSVAEGISELHPLAVDVSSGIQAEHARLKSALKMEQFVEAVLAADSLKVTP